MVNKVILVGNLCGEPNVKTFGDGSKLARFSIATNERYKNGNETKEHTEYHNIVVHGGLAEVAEKYLHKGDKVYIDGKLRLVKWEKDGNEKSQVDIIVNNFVMLGSTKKQPLDGADRREYSGANRYKEAMPF